MIYAGAETDAGVGGSVHAGDSGGSSGGVGFDRDDGPVDSSFDWQLMLARRAVGVYGNGIHCGVERACAFSHVWNKFGRLH